jgi:hypothetical protein
VGEVYTLELRKRAELERCSAEEIEAARNTEAPRTALTQLVNCSQLRRTAIQQGCTAAETWEAWSARAPRVSDASLNSLIARNQLRKRAIKQGCTSAEIAVAFGTEDALNTLMDEYNKWFEATLPAQLNEKNVAGLVRLADETHSIKRETLMAARDDDVPKPKLVTMLLEAPDFVAAQRTQLVAGQFRRLRNSCCSLDCNEPIVDLDYLENLDRECVSHTGCPKHLEQWPKQLAVIGTTLSSLTANPRAMSANYETCGMCNRPTVVVVS